MCDYFIKKSYVSAVKYNLNFCSASRLNIGLKHGMEQPFNRYKRKQGSITQKLLTVKQMDLT